MPMEMATATTTTTITTEPKPSLLLKQRFLVSFFSTVVTATSRRDGTVNRRLFNLFDLKSPPNPKPINNVKTYDVTVDHSSHLWFRVFTPTNSSPAGRNLPIIIYFHGGGFAHFQANSRAYDELCRRLAGNVGAVVVSVDYRLSPEHRYPAQYDDGLDVLKFLDGADRGKSLPEVADLSWCFVAGDSAGGNLAHHVTVRACGAQFRQLKVVGLVGIQPFFGGEERAESEKKDIGVLRVRRTDWYWKSFLPEGCDRDHEAVNVSGPRAVDISQLNFPATIVFVGGFDLLKDWQRRYCEWLKRNGKEIYKVEYPKMVHGFYAFAEFKESDQLMSEIKNFVHNRK
ncbi:hypothetical protein LguiB_016960 [Lonicera macranthoides]